MRVAAFLLAGVIVTAACGSAEDPPASAVLTGPGSSAEDSTVAATAAPTTTESSGSTAAPGMASGEGCADVIDAVVVASGDGYRVDATVSSADTGWEKYADAWEVRTPDGEVLGERVLTHPHDNEQPFTRSLSGVQIPTGVAEVDIAAHDSVAGFCGRVFRAEVPS